MSHFATIETEIRDIKALELACRELGLPLLGKCEARGYNTNKIKGEHVIKLKGPYDIALNRQPSGAFGMTTDWYAGYVEKEVGPKYGKLLQLYGVHKATAEARKKGYTVRRQTVKDGSIKLIIGGVR